MSKLETNTIDTISGSTTLTLGGTNATTIAQDSATTITGLKSTGIDDNATSTAITIDSSENVGIGTSSPNGILELKSTGNTNFFITAGNTSASQVVLGDTDDIDVGKITYSHNVNSMEFIVNASERMRISSGGNVGMGNQTTPFSTDATLNVDQIGGGFPILCHRDGTGDGVQISFRNDNGQVGRINTNGSATSYVTSSDYRLKENVSYDFDATTRLKQLRPARFNFIADADTTVDGFLAHEVQSVVPEAITGIKDETETKEKVVVSSNGKVIAENIEQADWETGKIADENGNTQYPTDSTWEATKVVPVYQGIDQSKLVPLLVKTIQELEARITALETQP
jgi:hypothetical protein